MNSGNFIVSSGAKWMVMNAGEQAEEMVTPYAEWVFGNLLSLGNGIEIAEAQEGFRESMKPRNILLLCMTSGLMGGANYAVGRSLDMIQEVAQNAQLDNITDNASTMLNLGIPHDRAIAIANTQNVKEKREMFQDAYVEVIEKRMQSVKNNSDIDRLEAVFIPDDPVAERLYEEGRIDKFEVLENGDWKITPRVGSERIAAVVNEDVSGVAEDGSYIVDAVIGKSTFRQQVAKVELDAIFRIREGLAVNS